MTEKKAKSRVSYARELRSEASLQMKGMATVSVTLANGDRVEVQAIVDVEEAQAVKWFAVLLGRPDVRPPEGLEDLVRRACEERGISE